MGNSHVLTFRRASCSAYSSSMGTPCWLRYCRWVRSSMRASFGRKLLAHTWEEHGGTGLGYPHPAFAKVPQPRCPYAGPCCHQVESPTCGSHKGQSSGWGVTGQTWGYPRCKKLWDQGRGIPVHIFPLGLL